jgi:peptidylprolyl isomerase
MIKMAEKIAKKAVNAKENTVKKVKIEKKETKTDKKETKKTNAPKGVVVVGCVVKVHYVGTLDSGEVFDSSESHGMPLEFTTGKGQMIKGFDNAVIGMKKGEEKKVRIEAKDAYGDPNPQMVQKVPKEALPKDGEPKKGMMLMIGFPNGMRLPAKIVEVDNEGVTLDLNHPLAGQALNFKITLVEIN